MRSGVLGIGAPALLAIVVVAAIVAACDSAGAAGRPRSLGRADAPRSERPGDRDGGDHDRHPDRVRRVHCRPGIDRQRGSSTPASAPPAATLAADGGEPAIGQLGSYTWLDGGSDSPGCLGPRSRWRGRAVDGHGRGRRGLTDWSARRVTAGTRGWQRGDRPRPGRRPAGGLCRAGRRHLVGPGHGPVRQRSRVGHLLLAAHGALNDGIGVAHFPRRCRPDPGHAACRPLRAAMSPSGWPCSVRSS